MASQGAVRARQRATDAAGKAVADKADDPAALEQGAGGAADRHRRRVAVVADEIEDAKITLSRTDVTVEMVSWCGSRLTAPARLRLCSLITNVCVVIQPEQNGGGAIQRSAGGAQVALT